MTTSRPGANFCWLQVHPLLQLDIDERDMTTLASYDAYFCQPKPISDYENQVCDVKFGHLHGQRSDERASVTSTVCTRLPTNEANILQ